STGATAFGPHAPIDSKTLVDASHIAQISSAVKSAPSSSIHPNASTLVVVTERINSSLLMHARPKTIDQNASWASVVTSRGKEASCFLTSVDHSTSRPRSRACNSGTKSNKRVRSITLRAGGVRLVITSSLTSFQVNSSLLELRL